MAGFRERAHAGLNALMSADDADFGTLARDLISAESVWDIAAPVNRLEGRDVIVEQFLRPLRGALAACRRRDEIFIGGQNIREEGGRWVASVTHYVGNFDAALWGVDPAHHLVFLRAGEFYRLDGPQGAEEITKARIIVDLPDLMRQCGARPFDAHLGTEMLFPGPATHDGVLPTPGRGTASLDLVERMLADLHKFDPDTKHSHGQTGDDGAWDEHMLWYGPGGIGANYLWDGFVKDHRADFLHAFPDRKGGDHYCRIGDGDYAAVSGWPSMTMTHRGPYLGVPATQRKMTLRVMDFYRCDYARHPSGKIAENWVLLDYVQLFEQMGVDLIARGNARG